MELLNSLLEQRANVWHDTKAMLDTIAEAKRDFTSEEQQEYDRRNTDLTDLDERIGQLGDLVKRNAAADEARADAERLIRPETERSQNPEAAYDSAAEAWFRSGEKGSYELPLKGLSVQRTNSGAWSVRTLTVGTFASGAATVPQSFRKQLYEHLIENSGIRNTRAEIIVTGSGEELVLPKTTAHPGNGTIVAEGGAIGQSDPTFGRGTLNAYKYAEIVYVPTELLTDTAVDLLGYLSRAFGVALANGSGAHMVTGDGSSKPQGVISAAGTIRQVTGGTYSSANGPTADQLIDLFYTVTEPYAKNGEWFMRRATVGKARKLKDSNGQYLWQPALTAGEPDTLLGRPIVQDPNVPAAGTSATSVAFGDFSTFKIRDVGSLRFERSDDFKFENDLVAFRTILRTDSELLDATGSIGTFVHGTVA